MFVEHGPEVGSSFGDVPLTNHFEAEPEVRFFGRLKILRLSYRLAALVQLGLACPAGRF